MLAWDKESPKPCISQHGNVLKKKSVLFLFYSNKQKEHLKSFTDTIYHKERNSAIFYNMNDPYKHNIKWK